MLKEEIGNITIKELNQVKREERIEIDKSGPLLAAIWGGYALVLGVDAQTATKSRDSVLEKFKNEETTRKYKIEFISETQRILEDSSGAIRQNCRESNFSYNARFLRVLSNIVKNDIANGALATRATKCLFGEQKIINDFDNFLLVQEVNGKDHHN